MATYLMGDGRTTVDIDVFIEQLEALSGKQLPNDIKKMLREYAVQYTEPDVLVGKPHGTWK